MFLRLRVSWTSRFGACAAARFRCLLRCLQHFVHQCFALREVVNASGFSRFRLDWFKSVMVARVLTLVSPSTLLQKWRRDHSGD